MPGITMPIVFIYGPPAAGKLTVAKELSAVTGYKLFDNHVTIDWGEAVLRVWDGALLEAR
jgi:shikimate kinase